jgi:hypothetical protein
MVSKIFLFIAIANILFLNEFANSFVYYNSLNTLNNLNMRFIGDISRRNLLELIPSSVVPAIVHPKYVFAYKGEPQNTNLLNKINKVAVFGASGYTGGDTVRTLINKNINLFFIRFQALSYAGTWLQQRRELLRSQRLSGLSQTMSNKRQAIQQE